MLKNITDQLLDKLSSDARASARKRANYNLHAQLDDPVQRLLNAVEPESYVHPHRHTEPGKWELFVVVRGRFQLFIFDDQGTILEKVALSASSEASKIIEIPADTWHCVIAEETGSVFFETKPGPYLPLSDKDFAAWAPREGETGVTEFLSRLRQLNKGDSACG